MSNRSSTTRSPMTTSLKPEPLPTFNGLASRSATVPAMLKSAFPRFKSAPLLAAVALALAAIAPTAALADTQTPDQPTPVSDRKSKWHAYRNLFTSQKKTALLKHRREMRRRVRDNHPHVTKQRAKEVVREYMKAVLNGQVTQNPDLDLQDFDAWLSTSFTGEQVAESPAVTPPPQFFGGAMWDRKVQFGVYPVYAEPVFKLTLDNDSNIIYSKGGRYSHYYRTTYTQIDLGFGDGWDVHRYQQSNTAIMPNKGTTIKTGELWTDRASTSATDYMVGGVWLDHFVEDGHWIMSGHQRIHAFVSSDNAIGYSPSFTGAATYTGPVLGFYGIRKIGGGSYYVFDVQRLTGTVTINADFGTGEEWGSVSGSLHDLALDGQSVPGAIQLPSGIRYGRPGTVGIRGSINGVHFDRADAQGRNLLGSWTAHFHGPTSSGHPTGIAGTVTGAMGVNDTANSMYTSHRFEASFGARKVEEE